MKNETDISVVEAIVLASPEPITARRIVDVHDDLTPSKVGKAVAELNNRYMQSGSSFRIRELAGGYQFHITPEYSGYVEELFSRQRKVRLTRASLETLAIIAYRQPVTKTQIEHIRGVASDGVLHNLLEKKLVTIRGRAETVGKALQYGTTAEFLKFFGLNKLEDLPQMDEIEELLKAREPQNQTELELPEGAEPGVMQKLNVADGTYDPDRWDNDDDSNGESTKSNIGEQVSTAAEIDSKSISVNQHEPGTEVDSTDDSETPEVIVDVDTT